MRTVKRFLSFMLPVMLVATLMFSCSTGAKKECSVIPEDAMFVANAKLGALLTKSDFANIDKLKSVSELRNELKEDEPYLDDLLESVMKDPSITGINVKEDMLFFGYKEGKNQVYVIALTMSNKANFEEFLRKISKASGSSNSIKPYTDSKNNLTYIDFGDEAIASYNDERVLFVVPERNVKTETLQRYAADLFNLEEGKCITSIPTFNEYWSNRGDVSVFYSYKTIFADYSPRDIQRMAGFLPEDVIKSFENMAMSFSLAFENEGVNLLWSAYGLPESMKKVANKNFNKDLIKYMPEKTYIAGSFACNIDGIIEFFEKSGSKDNPMDEKIGIKNFTIKDFLNAFGGSLIVSLYDLSDEDNPEFAAALDIKDKSMIQMVLKEDFKKGSDGLYYYNGNDFDNDIRIYLDDNVMVVSNSEDVLNKASNGGYNNGLKEISGKIGNGNYAYIDLNTSRYPEELFEDMFRTRRYRYNYYTDDYDYYYETDRDAEEMFYEIMSWFTCAEAYTSDNNTTIKLRTSDNSQNSLTFFLKKFDKIILKYMY